MYERFGDVLTFDTTYKTNRYDMSFVPFTGVNHHYQSILFGFALLRDETEETFAWVLQTWLHAMDYRAPVTIITDQDKAISNAIVKVLPTTHHILCSWHISNKYPEKLHHIYAEHPSFKSNFNNYVYNSLSIDEFEECWDIIMKDYELYNNDLLRSLYEVKEKWIQVYTKRYFAAGITTTGRSEGMNSFFDEYVNASTEMKDFVVKSQKTIEKQFLKERQSDYVTAHRKRKLMFRSSLEFHVANVYTKEIFRRFQVQLLDSMKYNIQKVSDLSLPDTKIYVVYKSDQTEDNRRYRHLSHYRLSKSITCSCQMMSHSGEICRNILRFLTCKCIAEIPSNMILHRWTRDANKSSVDEVAPKPIIANFEQDQIMQYNYLTSDFQEVATKASCSVRGYKTVLKINARVKLLVDECDPDKNNPDVIDDH